MIPFEATEQLPGQGHLLGVAGGSVAPLELEHMYHTSELAVSPRPRDHHHHPASEAPHSQIKWEAGVVDDADEARPSKSKSPRVAFPRNDLFTDTLGADPLRRFKGTSPGGAARRPMVDEDDPFP